MGPPSHVLASVETAGGRGALKQRGAARSALKGRWHRQCSRSFSYDPFGAGSGWEIEFADGDLIEGGESPATVAEEAQRPPTMCVARARQELTALHAGGATVARLPAGLSADSAAFLQAHTCAFTLRCKRHLAVETAGDTMSMLLRPLCTADRAALQEGLGRLSSRSQVMRFLGPMPRLSEHDLTYLTDLDYHRHFAWTLSHEGLGVAVGRYVCEADDPSRAELALTVIDSLQGLGLSSLLTWALGHVAHQEGVRYFTAVFHPQNAPVTRMVEKLAASGLDATVREGRGEGFHSMEIQLPMPVPDVALSLLSEEDMVAFMHAMDGQATAHGAA
mmetsp:Transcript_17276/g.44851  ORF Transcript_17276/g.44851 Transcript_17276/m.44851 type:complete len:333 (+) Transcript_17276:114-1112(+)